MNTIGIIWYIGVIDAVIIILFGLIGAVAMLLDLKSDIVVDRLVPAGLTLAVSSIAAGTVVGITNWLVGG